jgi:hypothetical protein
VLKVFLPDSRTLFAFEYGDWKAWTTHEVELQIARKSIGTIRGTVRAKEKAVEDARIYLYSKAQRSLSTFYPVARTDKDGQFLFDNLAGGAYVLHVASDSCGRTVMEVNAPADDVIVRYPERALGAVEGSVEVLIEGRPLPLAKEPPKGFKDYPRGLFLCNEKGEPLFPLIPVAFVQKQGNKEIFRAENLNPGKTWFTILGCVPNKPCDLFAVDKNFFGPGMDLIFEEWRVGDVPQLRIFLDKLCVEVEAGKTAKLDVKIDLSDEECRRLGEELFEQHR